MAALLREAGLDRVPCAGLRVLGGKLITCRAAGSNRRTARRRTAKRPRRWPGPSHTAAGRRRSAGIGQQRQFLQLALDAELAEIHLHLVGHAVLVVAQPHLVVRGAGAAGGAAVLAV